MKKFLVFILSFVYLTSSVGATVHLHYCMDKLVEWGFSSDKKKCSNCGMEKNADGCCKDEQKHVKLKADQKTPQVLNLLSDALHFAAVAPPHHYHYDGGVSSAINLLPKSHAPPLPSMTQVYLFNCTFRI